ncbi:MAG: nitroreductase family protein [Lentisphaeria bacterium]|nr:nitroreductase family protein [Lentisphaeria bacterium]
MDFLDMMNRRHSCRAYDPAQGVSREELLKIVEAGRLSPSGCNSQPWKFIVVDSPEAKEKLCDAIVVGDGVTGAPWRHQVPAFIILIEKKAKVMPMVVEYYKDTQRFAPGDIGAACMNMCHEAFCLGLDTCMIGMNDQAKMEKYFGIPADCIARVVLAVGHAANPDAPVNKVRKPLEEVCSFNYWE